ncbi:DUF2231 domain-containing protein [Paenarthrobacter sp. DKR-5]|uniref:DUF2231 domain-containing protein n=1 Tax=Paenarthrobacter sp. DKR-5 TaxID=2835535 RepID=UPI001BDBD70C|nr:DUF2231 domain-containing protein [Paenarthrobacter sp. DKR-5]MBT1002870.1 DUF2231 domain-containing protein [Paenarthrobacter sp. DKR-5]
MSIRLEQMHPAFVHVPVAFLPVSVGADLIAGMTNNEPLLSFGRQAVCIAAASAVASAVTGLIAGEEVNVQGASMDMLMTHRNLNFLTATVAAGMAIWRTTHRKPTVAYIATGMIGTGVLAYTSYLGGKLVYDTGVGVGPAGGVYRLDAPVLKFGQLGQFLKTGGTDLVHGAQHMAQEVKKGNIAPTIMAGRRLRPGAARQVVSG